jgi:hypothetical protein
MRPLGWVPSSGKNSFRRTAKDWLRIWKLVETERLSRSVSRLSRIDVLLRLWQHHYLPDHTQIVMQNAFVVVCARLREGDSEMRRIECYRVVRI